MSTLREEPAGAVVDEEGGDEGYTNGDERNG